MKTYEDAEVITADPEPSSTPAIVPQAPVAVVAAGTEMIRTTTNDVGFADKIVSEFKGSVRFIHGENKWLLFDPKAGWVRDESRIMFRSVGDLARRLYEWALREASSSSMDTDQGKRLIAAMASLGSKHRIESALEFVKVHRDVSISVTELDADPDLVGVQNGVVNIATGVFTTHSREHLVTRRLATDYIPGATAPAWLKFLGEVQPDPEMRAFLQRLCGYTIHGKIVEHVLPFHLGNGANGKGTFLEQGMLRLMSDYSLKLSDSLVYASERGNPPFLEILKLCGVRFGLGQENAQGGRLNEKFLKDATGGDKQKGRGHYSDFTEYWPSAKLHLVGNHRPRIDGTDFGIWRRFVLVEWPVQVPAEKCDANLGEKLTSERPGILNWILVGAKDWLVGGLQIPKQCRVATEEFRRSSDSLRDFLEDAVVEDGSGSITKSELYRSYQAFADESGIRNPMSKRKLGLALMERGWRDSISSSLKQRIWVGYRAKHDFE